MRIALGIVSLLVAGAVGVVTWLVPASLLDLRNPFRSETVDRSQPVLLTSIQDISEYHAAVGNFEIVLDYEDDVTWVPGFIAGERSLFVAAGTVDAYVDLAGLTDGDLTVSDDGTSAEVRLPDATLGEPNLDQGRTYLFSQERGVVNRLGDALSTQDQQELYQRAEEKLAAAAAESELERQAEENTRAMLTGLFDSLDVTVTFVDAG
jgi:hypothetical protein